MYASAHDLELMKDLLRAAKREYPHSGIHSGDLDWWVFYDTSGVPLQDKVRLWFDGEQLVAWTWSRLHRSDYDMFVHPAYRDTPQQDAVLTQTIDVLSARLRQQPREDDSKPQITATPTKTKPRTLHCWSGWALAAANSSSTSRRTFAVGCPHRLCRTGSRFWSACARKTPSGGRWRIRTPSSRIRK